MNVYSRRGVVAIAAIAARHAEIAEWRRDIHAHPETAFEEHRTAALVAGRLADWGLEVHRGLVGVLHRGAGERRIGLRAEMDALPINEANTSPRAPALGTSPARRSRRPRS